MKLEIISKIAFAGMLGLLASQSAQAQNLLANPGFENGDFTGWTVSGSTDFEGVSQTFATDPNSGSWSAFFGAVGGFNIISQTIATTVGDTYGISFALDNSGGPYAEAYVNWGGTQVWDIQPDGVFGWTGFVLPTQVATSASTTVTFGFRQDPSYFNLDDTRVVDLTHPNTVPDQGVGLWASAAILLGLCAVAGYHRRQTA